MCYHTNLLVGLVSLSVGIGEEYITRVIVIFDLLRSGGRYGGNNLIEIEGTVVPIVYLLGK